MNAEDAVVDDDREGEKVEHVGEVLPHGRAAVLADALAVEPVRLGHGAALVVAADELDAVRVPQLEARQERDGLDAEEAAVDVVAEEEVVGFGREAAVLEQAQEVVVLAVDVTCCRRGIVSNEDDVEGARRERDAPQILMGASSSRRMGWLMKISRALVHRNLISYSWS